MGVGTGLHNYGAAAPGRARGHIQPGVLGRHAGLGTEGHDVRGRDETQFPVIRPFKPPTAETLLTRSIRLLLNAAEITTLQARIKELEGMLWRIADSGEINTEFSQFQEGDVDGPAMSHARKIAKQALKEAL